MKANDMNNMQRSPSSQRGITIIEVLVAMLILAVGLLGMASLQVRAVSDTSNSSFRSIAIFYANDLADRIRSTPAGSYGAHTTSKGSAANAGTKTDNCLKIAGCSPAAMVNHDYWEWENNIELALPDGAGEVALNGDVYTVTVSWNARVQAEDADGNQTNTATSEVNFSFEP